MFIEDKDTHKGPIHIQLKPSMTVLELKEKISTDYKIPTKIQRWILNKNLVISDSQRISEFNIKDQSIIYLYIVGDQHEKKAVSDLKISNVSPALEANGQERKQSVDNTAKLVDVKVNNDEEEEGAKALPLLLDNPYGTLKIGWTCPLCTLINSPNRPGCVACSETRPSNYVIPSEYKVNEDPFEIPDELKQFLEDDIDNCNKLPKLQIKNDLNKANVNRRSTEIFNIIVKEESLATPIIQNTNHKDDINPNIPASKSILNIPIVMTAITASPNITKNKYRGVDNYNPHIIKKPEISGIPYKSPLVKPLRQSKLQQPMLLNSQAFIAKKPITQKSTSDLVMLTTTVKTTTAPSSTALATNQALTNLVKTTTTTENSQHYKELLKLDNSSVVPNIDAFECPVCFMKYKPGEGIVLRDCIHTFCRECIVNTVKYSEEAEVKCPYMDSDYSCDSLIQEREIRSLMTREEYDIHLAISLKVAEHRTENAFHCKTPSCRGWCIYEDNVNQFKCPICKIMNCLTCRVSVIFTYIL